MTNEKAIQKAGDNSQQYQANTMNFIQGIDEKRAREICYENPSTFLHFRKFRFAEVYRQPDHLLLLE